MQHSQFSTNSTEVQVDQSAPWLIKLIAFLGVLIGIIGLLINTPLVFFGAAAGIDVLFSPVWFAFVYSFVFLIVAVGLFKMQRWAIYLFTTVAVIRICTLFYVLFQNSFQDTLMLIEILIQGSLIQYFWRIIKKFK